MDHDQDYDGCFGGCLCAFWLCICFAGSLFVICAKWLW
jgi:hypothetical protein